MRPRCKVFGHDYVVLIRTAGYTWLWCTRCHYRCKVKQWPFDHSFQETVE